MSKPAMKGYPAEFKERAVKLAVDQINRSHRRPVISGSTKHTPHLDRKYHGLCARRRRSMTNICMRN